MVVSVVKIILYSSYVLLLLFCTLFCTCSYVVFKIPVLLFWRDLVFKTCVDVVL